MLRLLIRKRLSLILAYLLLSLLGLFVARELPVQLYPRVNRPRLSTSIRHPGYSAVAFRRAYAETIEPRLLAVPGLELLEARYGVNQSSYTLTFDWESEALAVKAATESALSSVYAALPEELRATPNVRFFSGDNAGYLMVGLSSASLPAEELYRAVRDKAEARLLGAPDLDLLEILPVEELRASISLRRLDMLQYGVTIADVDAALAAGDAFQSLGTLQEGRQRLAVSYREKEVGLRDLPSLVVKRVEGVGIRLDAVADVEIAYALPSTTFAVEGERGVQLVASPVDGGNISAMSKAVLRSLEELRAEGALPADLVVAPLLDPSVYIDRSMAGVLQSLLLGAALAMAVVFLLLGEIRNSLIIGVSIPLSLVLSFVPMRLLGVSLNLISLGGMALAVGMIVDASIVVVENIHRYRVDEGHAGDEGHLVELVVKATAEVGPSVLASTLTSVLVFLPLSFTAPLANAILGEQAKVVVLTLGFSLLVSLSFIPVLAFLAYRGDDLRGRLDEAARARRNPSERVQRGLERAYAASLRFLVTRRRFAVLLLGAVLLLSLLAVLIGLPRLPRELLSPPRSDRLIVFIQPTAERSAEEIVETKLPEMKRAIDEALGPLVLRSYAEVRSRFTRLFLVLRKASDSDRVTAELQRLFPTDNDWSYSVMGWDPAELPLPSVADLRAELTGPDEAVLVPLLERARDLVLEGGDYARVFTTPATGYAEGLSLAARQEVAGQVPGLSSSSLLALLRRVLGGTRSRVFEEEGLSVSARAVYPEAELRGREALGNFLVPYERSAVPLKHFFDFELTSEVAQVATEGGRQVFRLSASRERGAPAGERAALEAKTRALLAEKLELPSGYALRFENPAAELDGAVRSLLLSLVLSVGLIYLLLCVQYDSLVLPLVVLAAVPLGFIGLVFSLLVFRSTLSLNSLLGAILLSGIVVNNSIILIDFYLVRREAVGKIEAIVESAGVRLRPILITSLTTIFGMLPVAIGLGEGASVIKPLGIAVSGGLFVSTLLTLFVVPTILSLGDFRKKRLPAKAA